MDEDDKDSAPAEEALSDVLEDTEEEDDVAAVTGLDEFGAEDKEEKWAE